MTKISNIYMIIILVGWTKMTSKKLNILHVSDVHFTSNDKTHTQKKITTALINSVSNYDGLIDYCVFTGDLANHATPDEYEIAGNWLEALYTAIKNPNAKMIICPGNHDVNRKQANIAALRGASINQDIFDQAFTDTTNNQHLDNFNQWHSKFKSKNNWVISSWEKNAHYLSEQHNGININFVMINSAILACDNDDYGHLCVDINEINYCLNECTEMPGVNVCLMHHPLDAGWFAKWNNDKLSTILKQSDTCDILLTGHVHDSEGDSMSNNLGQSIANFKCGAAYPDANWKKEFTILELDIENNKVIPNNYSYHEQSGKWHMKNEESMPVAVNFRNILETTQKKK